MEKYGVYIGRFQPLHNAHLYTMKFALDRVEKLIIVIGSTTTSKSIKNPWTSDERQKMILDSLKDEHNIDSSRIIFVNAVDYLYNDNLWTTALQTNIASIIDEVDQDKVILFGHDKDKSTFYLRLFPKWLHIDFGEIKTLKNINATMIRNAFFAGALKDVRIFIPNKVYDFLLHDVNTQSYIRLTDEYNHIQEYRSIWSVTPFPPTFVTTDAVVVKSGHILVVRRKVNPGQGLIALPGGFLNQDEFIVDGMLRELKEETGIALPKDELKKRIVDQRVFDHPNRSLRGRTITHAYCMNLGFGDLPNVKGNDDADKAWWMSLRDVNRNEEQFFEDHFHIIQHFVHKF
jgi:bifunctional NMN adenylyltransferase/nudix hydrolase